MSVWRLVLPPSSPDVLLADEHTGMVDGLGQTLLEDNCLQASLEEIVRLEGQDVIELVLGLVQEAILIHAAHQGLALKNALGILLVEREKRACSITDLAEDHLHAPKLTLVAKAILSNELQLGIQALLLKRASWLLEGLAI